MNSVYDAKEPLFNDGGLSIWNLEDNIHIWKFPAIQISTALLSAAENESAGRFRFEGDRNRYSAGRYALRILLSRYLSVNPAELSISAESGLKPVLKNPSANIHFNLSHSGECILIAVAREPVGIDTEKMDAGFSFQEIVQEHFSTEEKDFVYSSQEPARAFYYIWTRKEALTKAWGTGLQENLKELMVLNKNSGFEMNEKIWKLESFTISAFYPAAVACPESLGNIYFFNGSPLITLS